MKIKANFKALSFLAPLLTAIGLIGLSSPAMAQSARMGKNFDEIVKLAKNEGGVRTAAGWDPENVRIILKEFQQKYPMVKIQHTEVTGIASRERILNEAIGGIFEHDLVSVSGELRQQYIKAGALAGPIEWGKLFPDTKEAHISPDKYFVIGGFSTYGIVYNPSLVPPGRIPKRWEDCLDPHWKGKLAVYARPRAYTALYAEWGEEKIINFSKRLKDNQPAWTGSQTGTITQVAAGEYPLACGIAYHSTKGVMTKDPTAKIAFAVPTEQPFHIGEALAVMKGAKNPNAASLLAAWLASGESQKGYEVEGRTSPFVEGTEAWKQVKASGGKAIWGGWDVLTYEAEVARKIVAAWGFPKAKR